MKKKVLTFRLDEQLEKEMQLIPEKLRSQYIREAILLRRTMEPVLQKLDEVLSEMVTMKEQLKNMHIKDPKTQEEEDLEFAIDLIEESMEEFME